LALLLPIFMASGLLEETLMSLEIPIGARDKNFFSFLDLEK